MCPISRDTELAKKALLAENEKSIWAVDTHTCQQKLSLPHKKGRRNRHSGTTQNRKEQAKGQNRNRQVAEVKESKGLKLSCQLSKAQA